MSEKDPWLGIVDPSWAKEGNAEYGTIVATRERAQEIADRVASLGWSWDIGPEVFQVEDGWAWYACGPKILPEQEDAFQAAVTVP